MNKTQNANVTAKQDMAVASMIHVEGSKLAKKLEKRKKLK
jgi:hypothetical protein